MVGSYLSEQIKKMKQIPGETASVLSIESFLVNIFVLLPFFDNKDFLLSCWIIAVCCW